MFATAQARALYTSWTSFCRGETKEPPRIWCGEVAVLMQYGVELIGKRSFDKTVADYFKACGKPDINSFVSSLGFTPTTGARDGFAVPAEVLYVKMGTDLFIADYAAPDMFFLSKTLPSVAPSFLAVVDEAIASCVKYGGRNWVYFKKVCEQMVANARAADYMENQEQEAMLLPPGYFEHLADQAEQTADANHYLNQTRELIQSAKEDKLMDENVKKHD